MPLPPTEALEILATELADDMIWQLVFVVFHPSIEPRHHRFNFVFGEFVPVNAVEIALPAVVVLRLVDLVASHFLLSCKSLAAVVVSALDLQLLAIVFVCHSGKSNGYR